MKKLILLLFVLLLPICLSLHNLIIYDDWVLSGEKLNISNQTFKAIYVKNNNSTIVYFPEGISIVIFPGNKTCSSEWIYSVCQSGQKFEKNGKEVIPSINDPNIDVYLNLEINSTNISLSFSKELNKTMYLGDRILVKTIIEKKGTTSFYDMTNISYIDSFSEDFDIQITEGCNQKKHSVVWESETLSSKHECVYVLTPKKELNFTNMVILSYDVLGKKQEKTFSYSIESIALPFAYEIIINKDLKKIGELSNFTLRISPLSDFVFEKIEFEQTHGFSLESEVEKNIELNKSDVVTFIYFFNNTQVGNYSANFDLYYLYGLSNKKISGSVGFEYVANSFDTSLFERSNMSIIRLNNPSADYFTNISLKLNTVSLVLDYLGSKKFYEFEIERVNQTAVNLTYDTKYGQKIENFVSLSLSEEVSILDNTQLMRPKTRLNINIPIEVSVVVVGSLFVFFVLFVFISKSKKNHSNLDKEIEEIRKKKL